MTKAQIEKEIQKKKAEQKTIEENRLHELKEKIQQRLDYNVKIPQEIIIEYNKRIV